MVLEKSDCLGILVVRPWVMSRMLSLLLRFWEVSRASVGQREKSRGLRYAQDSVDTTDRQINA